MTGRAESRKYHYFYKITNNLNGHFYYGVHNTDNLDDGYMGSGKRLQHAYKKYGAENFTKEIVKFFGTSKEAFEYEAEIVTENLVMEDGCYNCELGGVFIDTTGFVPVKDKDGNNFLVSTEDERYRNGELLSINKGTVLVEDSDGNRMRVSTEDNRYQSGLLKSPLIGKIVVKDSYGKCFMVSTEDERYLNGDLKPLFSGKKHTQETILKMKTKHKETGHQRGEKNSQFGSCWINDGTNNKKIQKNELDKYLVKGWFKGRIISEEIKKKMRNSIKTFGGTDTVWISNDSEQKTTYVKKEKLSEFLDKGWVLGRKYYKRF